MAETDIRNPSGQGGIPAPRLRAGRQHVLETAFGLLASAPAVRYLMSFIVRMRYCPDSDSCQVVIQPHYSAAGEYDEEVREEILLPLAQTIRATLGAKVSRRTCAYISASSTMDQDNLADLFILYFFAGEESPGQGPAISGIYQMNLALRTFAPEMEEIAVGALERCLSVFRRETRAP